MKYTAETARPLEGVETLPYVMHAVHLIDQADKLASADGGRKAVSAALTTAAAAHAAGTTTVVPEGCSVPAARSLLRQRHDIRRARMPAADSRIASRGRRYSMSFSYTSQQAARHAAGSTEWLAHTGLSWRTH